MCAYVKMQRNTCFSQRKQIEWRLYLYTYFIVRVHRSRRVENTDDDWPKLYKYMKSNVCRMGNQSFFIDRNDIFIDEKKKRKKHWRKRISIIRSAFTNNNVHS